MNQSEIAKIKKSAAENYGGNLDAAICEYLGHPSAVQAGNGQVPFFLSEEVKKVRTQIVKTSPAHTPKKKVLNKKTKK